MSDFLGLTATQCPTACTAARCVISTVAQCKHPLKSSDDGCGPITLCNRVAARKFLGDSKVVVGENGELAG
jgi:hypothetical protein